MNGLDHSANICRPQAKSSLKSVVGVVDTPRPSLSWMDLIMSTHHPTRKYEETNATANSLLSSCLVALLEPFIPMPSSSCVVESLVKRLTN